MGRLSNIRWKRLLLLGSAGSVLGVALLVGVGYAMTDVPEPNESAVATATRILYSDRSEMGRVGQENRIPVPLSKVPEHVQLAVLSAEDRGHYTNPGINPKGITRALFANVRGGGVEQGGSSITQQYAKNAFLTQDRTFSRKVKEVFIALKMSRTVEKDKILEDYLNTIYFGRQASGIEVASQVYFGRPVDQLSVAQGAVLAASIKSPASLDPQKHPEYAKARWEYVLDGMVKQGWLTEADRAKQVYPPVAKIGAGNRNNDLSGPKGHVIQQVLAELETKGFDEAELSGGGLVVETTIRKKAQEAAIAAVQDLTGDKPKEDDLQGALVSVQPGTGQVWAYYGGATGTGFDFAKNNEVGRSPGSSFKPYVLATALEEGLSLRTRLDGNNEKDFPGIPEPIENFGEESYGRVDLIEATQRSINTAYFELGLEVGPKKVAELAHRAGIPDSTKLEQPDGTVEGGIALGKYDVQVIDQAVGFATFANRGVPAKPFMVRKVEDDGTAVDPAEAEVGERAFSEDVAADATYAMQQVVERGTGRGARLDGGREAAGKTGTSSDNEDAWFVGYTPQLSTAVWLGYAQKKTIEIDGVEATGGGFSSRIWKAYTDIALEGQPEEDFPEPVYVGSRKNIGSDSDSDGDREGPRPRRSRSGSSSSDEDDEDENETPATSQPEPEPQKTKEPEPQKTEEPPPPQESEAPEPPPAEPPPPPDPSPGT